MAQIDVLGIWKKKIDWLKSSRGQTSLALVDQSFVSGINFLTGLLLARFLGLEGFGQYVLAFGIILFSAGIQYGLVIAPMMVFGPTHKGDEARDYFAAVFIIQAWLCIFTVLVIVVATYILASFFPEWGLHNKVAAIASAAAAFMLQDYGRRYFFANGKPINALKNDLLSYGARVFAFVVLGQIGLLDTGYALWIIAVSSMLGFLTSGVWRINRTGKAGHNFSLRNILNRHWVFGRWLIASNLAYWSSTKLVFYIVGAVVSISAVGALNATMILLGVANILFLALENILPSRASGIYANKGRAGLRSYLYTVTIKGLLITGFIAIGASIWAEELLTLLYGEAYSIYDWLVWWWAGYYILGYLQRPLSVGLRVVGKTHGIFLAGLLGTVIVLLFGYSFTDSMGLRGAMVTLYILQIGILLTMGTFLFRLLFSRASE